MSDGLCNLWALSYEEEELEELDLKVNKERERVVDPETIREERVK